MMTRNVHYTLRIASAMCFVGHGAFGIITKEVWCNYFAVFGIGHDLAYKLMPIVGSIDILMGLSILVYPVRAVFGWLAIWGFLTASMRPLSGEPLAELLERAGNYGAPLAFLLLSGIPGAGLSSRKLSSPGLSSRVVSQARGWFARIRMADANPNRTTVQWILRIAAFLLLAGHGWLNLLDTKGLIDQYIHLGFANPRQVALVAGVFELAAAVWILLRPSPPVLVLLLIWKIGTELWYPHWEVFEWVERGGSYGVLLALLFSLRKMSSIAPASSAPANTLGLST